MSKKQEMTWMKPFSFTPEELQQIEEKTKASRGSVTRSQRTRSSKALSLTSKKKRSFSQNDIKVVDLTLDKPQKMDDDEIPFKKPKMSSLALKTVPNPSLDIKKLLIPKSSDTLVIHAKKILEVKGWFEECERLRKVRSNPILLVTGPCGSGKLTCVKVLAEENGYDVHEYVAPLDYDWNVMTLREIDSRETKEGQAESFMKFLRDTTRYGTIFNKARNKKLIICKDIPNAFSEEPQLFQKVLQDYIRSGRAPLVFITNDTKGKKTNLNYKLFNDETMATYKIAQITFNPVSYMQVSKHLKLVASKMADKQFAELYSVPNTETIESIIVSSQGDLRNATINLLFACQKGAVKMGTEKEPSKLTEKKQAKKYKNLGADENVTMMHLLGKIFNPKYERKDDMETLTNDPESLTDMFSTQANTCLKMVFVNYAPRFTRMEDVAMAADFLSSSDVIMNDYRDDVLTLYGLNIGIRGAMVSNTDPAKGFKGTIRGFKNIFSKEDSKYGKVNVNQKSAKTAHNAFAITTPFKSWTSKDLPSSTYVCDCASYSKIIKSDPNLSFLNIDDEEFEDEIYEIEDFSDEGPDI